MTDAWGIGPLSEFAEVSRLRTDPRLLGDESLVHYSIPVLDETGLPAVEAAATIASHKFTVPRDAVLVSLLNPRIPRVWKAIGAPNAVCSTEFAVLTPTADGLETDFLYLLCQSEAFWEELQKRAVGTTGSRQRAKVEGLLSISVAIPPLPVQRRIVDLMAHLDDHLANLRAEYKLAQSLNTVLNAELTSPSDDWTETYVRDVVAFAGGYAFSERYQGQSVGAVPFFKVSDMNRPENAKYLSVAANYVGHETLSEMKAKPWPPGTVVFPKVGAALLTEKRRILGVTGAFDNNCMGLVPSDDVLAEFLYARLCSVRMGEFAQQGAVPSVNQSHVGSIPIWLPSLERQAEVVDVLVTTSTGISALGAEINIVSQLRASILRSLLTGSVTVQESYDSLLSEVA